MIFLLISMLSECVCVPANKQRVFKLYLGKNLTGITNCILISYK